MTASTSEPFRVAVAQLSPVFLDRDATVERACAAITEAASNGARLVAFPEGFVPGYPLWVWSLPAGETHALRALYVELLREAVTVGDAATQRLAAAAREAGVYVAIGINERNAEASASSLYNSLLFLDPSGAPLGVHRKLVPTAGERLVHAQGDGSTLDVFPTPLGRLSGLICWENYMPLARHALYAQGVELYVAPTWDRGEPWLSTLRHIAKEGRVYVLGCCSAMQLDDVPERYAFRRALKPSATGWINPGDSVIVDPDGKVVAGPSHERQEILYADIAPDRVLGPRWQLDVAGHYGRPDVFQLTVDRAPRPQLVMRRSGASPPAPSTPPAPSPPARA
jgi:nitrilase